MSLSLDQFLLLFMWFPTTALFVFLLLIARFYEKFSGRRTFYRLFLAPILLFGAVSVRYASSDTLAGDGLADIAFGIGGIILIALCWNLYRLMIVNNKGKGHD
jgi:hypothetical protein